MIPLFKTNQIRNWLNNCTVFFYSDGGGRNILRGGKWGRGGEGGGGEGEGMELGCKGEGSGDWEPLVHPTILDSCRPYKPSSPGSVVGTLL